jgi:hypothetical protein
MRRVGGRRVPQSILRRASTLAAGSLLLSAFVVPTASSAVLAAPPGPLVLPQAVALPGPAQAVILAPGGQGAWVLVTNPAEVVQVSATGAVSPLFQLPATPTGGLAFAGSELLVPTGQGIWIGPANGTGSTLAWQPLVTLLGAQLNGTGPAGSLPSSPSPPGNGAGFPSGGTLCPSLPVPLGGGGSSLSYLPSSENTPQMGASRVAPLDLGSPLPSSGPSGEDVGCNLPANWQQQLQGLLPATPPTTVEQLVQDLTTIEAALQAAGLPSADFAAVLIPWLSQAVEPALLKPLGVSALAEWQAANPTAATAILDNPAASSDLAAGLLLGVIQAAGSGLPAWLTTATNPATGQTYRITPGQPACWIFGGPAAGPDTVPLAPPQQDFTPYVQPGFGSTQILRIDGQTLFVPADQVDRFKAMTPAAWRTFLARYQDALQRLQWPPRGPQPAPQPVCSGGQTAVCPAATVRVKSADGRVLRTLSLRPGPAAGPTAADPVLVTHFGPQTPALAAAAQAQHEQVRPFSTVVWHTGTATPTVLGLGTGTGFGYEWGPASVDTGVLAEFAAAFGNETVQMDDTLTAQYVGQAVAGQTDTVAVTVHVATWSLAGSVGAASITSSPITIQSGVTLPSGPLGTQSAPVAGVLDSLQLNLPTLTDGTVEGEADALATKVWNVVDKATSYQGYEATIQGVLQAIAAKYGPPTLNTFSSEFRLSAWQDAEISVDPQAELVNAGLGTGDLGVVSLVWMTVREYQAGPPHYVPDQASGALANSCVVGPLGVFPTLCAGTPAGDTTVPGPWGPFPSAPAPVSAQSTAGGGNVPAGTAPQWYAWDAGWGPVPWEDTITQSWPGPCGPPPSTSIPSVVQGGPGCAEQTLGAGLDWQATGGVPTGELGPGPGSWESSWQASDPKWQLVVTPLVGPYWAPTGTGTPERFPATLRGYGTNAYVVSTQPYQTVLGPDTMEGVYSLPLGPGAYLVQSEIATPDGTPVTDSPPALLVVYPGSGSLPPGQYRGVTITTAFLPDGTVQATVVPAPGGPPAPMPQGTVYLEEQVGSPTAPVTVVDSAPLVNGQADFTHLMPPPPGQRWYVAVFWPGDATFAPATSAWLSPDQWLTPDAQLTLTPSGSAEVGGAPILVTGSLVDAQGNPEAYDGWVTLSATAGTVPNAVRMQGGRFRFWFDPPASGTGGPVTVRAALQVGGNVPALSLPWQQNPVATLAPTFTGQLLVPVSPPPAGVTITLNGPAPSPAASLAAAVLSGQVVDVWGTPIPFTGPLTVTAQGAVTVDGAASATVPVTAGQFSVTVAWPAVGALGDASLTFSLADPAEGRTLAGTIPVVGTALVPGAPVDRRR